MGKTKEHPIEYLKWWLACYHSNYTVDDVKMSEAKGYLRTTKPCNCTYPPYDGYTNFIPKGETHYHTLYIAGIRGFGRGTYAFWRALKTHLPSATQEENKN